MIKTITNIAYKLTKQNPRFLFAKKKKGGVEKDQYQVQLKKGEQFEVEEEELAANTVRDLEEQMGDRPINVDERYYKRSSQLYDRYVQTQLRPRLTTDGYQVNFSVIIQRAPIHFPYDQQNFKYFKDRFQLGKQSGYYMETPDFADQQKTYIYQDQQKTSPQNIISHSKNGQVYAQNSKFWRLVEPNQNDPKSIQNRSTSSVFLIVKDKDQKWVFPSRSIIQKQNFNEFKKNFISEMTGNPEYNVHWMTPKPIYVNTSEVDGLPRGKGIKTFYYNAYHLSGLYDRNQENPIYQDHLWVPKFELGNYFQRSYFQQVIPLVLPAL